MSRVLNGNTIGYSNTSYTLLVITKLAPHLAETDGQQHHLMAHMTEHKTNKNISIPNFMGQSGLRNK